MNFKYKIGDKVRTLSFDEAFNIFLSLNNSLTATEVVEFMTNKAEYKRFANKKGIVASNVEIFNEEAVTCILDDGNEVTISEKLLVPLQNQLEFDF